MNEINAFNSTVASIRDIFLEHISLRNKSFIRTPASFWGTYSFDDEGFTSRILEYFQSISDRLIQEKRKENIYYLIKIYENILANSLNVEYADKNGHGGNPLLSIILAYYTAFVEKLAATQDIDWVWESIKSLSTVSNFTLTKTNDNFTYDQINQSISRVSVHCLSQNSEAFLKEIVGVYFNQIRIGWDKYDHDEILWKDIFKELKKYVFALSLSSNLNLSTSELFIAFHGWQANLINWINKIEKDEEKKKYLDKYTNLLERWSDFLLDLARDAGLENKQIGLPVIQSIENNLNIIYVLPPKTKGINELYQTQISTLSWYFHKTEKVKDSFLFNLEQVFEILLREINENLKQNKFDIDYAIDLYIRLVEQHFQKVEVGYGYNHPRVIEKLIYLGLVLHKYGRATEEVEVLAKIDELNKKYLESNKELFEFKAKHKNASGPDEFQLCFELHELENDLFSYNRSHLMDSQEILRAEITKEIWDDFTKQIKYCEGIKYETRHIF